MENTIPAMRTIVEVDSVKNIITFGNINIAKNVQNTIC